MRKTAPLRDTLKKIATCLFALALSAGCFLSGCTGEKSTPTRETTLTGPLRIHLSALQEKNIGLETGTVSPVALINRVECNGQIQAADPSKVQVFSPAPGRIARLSVSLGQFVRQNQLLALIKSDEVGQLESELLQQILENEAELRQAAAQLELSKAAYAREQELLKEEVSSRADFEAARAQYKKDLATLSSLRIKNAAGIQSFRERLSLYGVGDRAATQVIRSRRIFPYLSITAPHSGIVTERNANPGELLDTSKTLLTISDLSQVWVVGDVYEKDIAKVGIGQPIMVKVDSLPNQTFAGQVDFISNLLDPQTRTLLVRGVMANPGLILKPNMFARMSVEVGRYTVLAVPQAAVQTIGDTRIAYVEVAPNTFEERRIVAGRQNERYMEIRQGLTEGETIAMSGTVGLKGIFIKKMGEVAAEGSGS